MAVCVLPCVHVKCGYRMSAFPENFRELVNQLPQLNKEVGFQLAEKIKMSLVRAKPSEESTCPYKLIDLLTNHMNCPKALQSSYQFLNISAFFMKREGPDIFDSIVDRNCSLLSGITKKGCELYLYTNASKITSEGFFHGIKKVIDDCHAEEKRNGATSLSFR